MSVQFAARQLASGQYAGRALSAIYKGATKIWPVIEGSPTLGATGALLTDNGTSNGIDTAASGSSFYVLTASLATGISVSDNKGNTYTKAWTATNTGSGDGFTFTLWECKNGTGGAGHTWTMAGATYPQLYAFEVKGNGTTPKAIMNGAMANGTDWASGDVVTTRDALLMLGMAWTTGGTNGDAAPTGFTKLYGMKDGSHYGMAIASGTVQPAGTYNETWGTSDGAAGATLLMAFQWPQPTVTLDLSALPASLTVDTPMSATITASNVDGATGAITISAPSLPPGLSISATTGSGPYTATISGTPTDEADAANFAISASNGAQSASADWNVAVNAAASSGVTVYTAYSGRTGGSSQSSTTINTTLSVEPGDTVVVLFSQNTATAVASVVDADGTFAARKFEPTAGGRNGSAGCFDHVVTSARSNYSVTVNTGEKVSELFVQVYVLRGSPLSYLSGSANGGSNDYEDSPVSMAMSTPGAAVVLSCATDWYGGQGAFTFSPSGYTVDTNAAPGDGFIAAHNVSVGAVSDTIVIDNPGSAQGGYNRITAIAVAYSY